MYDVRERERSVGWFITPAICLLAIDVYARAIRRDTRDAVFIFQHCVF